MSHNRSVSTQPSLGSVSLGRPMTQIETTSTTRMLSVCSVGTRLDFVFVCFVLFLFCLFLNLFFKQHSATPTRRIASLEINAGRLISPLLGVFRVFVISVSQTCGFTKYVFI